MNTDDVKPWIVRDEHGHSKMALWDGPPRNMTIQSEFGSGWRELAARGWTLEAGTRRNLVVATAKGSERVDHQPFGDHQRPRCARLEAASSAAVSGDAEALGRES